MKNNICKFLITGGQLAGKDTIILKLKKDLEEKGYFVIYTNEAAELIMKNNIRPFGDERVEIIKFQDAIFKTQVFTEDLYLSLAESIETTKPIVFLINRGLLDGKAFVTDEEFDFILSNNNYNINDIKKRYDIVFCFETMAKLGVYNQYDNNEVRYQNQQEAIDMNDRFLNNYSKYFENIKYFKATSSFDEKYKNIKDAAMAILEEMFAKNK